MNDLNPRDRELVAIGAAMGSNCVPCIEYHVPEARKTGLTDSQISEAIQLADRVRQVPARKVLNAARKLLPDGAAAATAGGKAAAAPATGAASGELCCGWNR